MTNTWKPTNRLTDDTVLFDAIGKIRESSDKRREIEARVLAENNLASVRQLSEDKKKQFCAIVDAILAEQADVNTQLFADDKNLAEAASKIKVTPWTKQDNNPEKNSTFTGAPKVNPNKGGYAGGAKAEKTKNGYTAMKRIKEDEDLDEAKKAKTEKTSSKKASSSSDNFKKYYDGVMSGKIKHKNDDERRTPSADYRDNERSRSGKIVFDEGLIKTAVRSVAGRAIAHDRAKKTGISAYSSQNKAFASGTSETDRGKNLAASKPKMKAYNKYHAISMGRKAPGSFGTRKEDLEEMYLDIQNFVLESEGIDSIDRLNEQGQEKLAVVVESVMEEILAEESSDLQELSKKTLGRYINKAAKSHGGEAVTAATSHDDDEADRADIKAGNRLQGIKRATKRILRKEETVKEGWFSDQKKKNFDDRDQLRKDALTNPKNAITHPSKAITAPGKAISHPSKAYISKPLYTSSRDKEGY